MNEQTPSSSMIAARRDLTLDDPSGAVAVPVTFSVPEYRDGSWECDFSIGWPDGAQSGKGYGADGVQAIYLAMQMVAANLYGSPAHKTGKLYLDHAGYGYGFRLPKGSRDLAVGNDKNL